MRPPVTLPCFPNSSSLSSSPSTTSSPSDRRLSTLARHLLPMDSRDSSISASPTSAGQANSVFAHLVRAPEDPILGVLYLLLIIFGWNMIGLNIYKTKTIHVCLVLFDSPIFEKLHNCYCESVIRWGSICFIISEISYCFVLYFSWIFLTGTMAQIYDSVRGFFFFKATSCSAERSEFCLLIGKRWSRIWPVEGPDQFGPLNLLFWISLVFQKIKTWIVS